MISRDRYHFIAIGGIGMSALAQILLERGIQVSGSDSQKSPITDQLEKMGAKIFIGYDPKNLLDSSSHLCAHPAQELAIVYSTAAISKNPEFEAAKTKGVILLHRSELLAELMKNKKPLLVAGTHGKTTTSSLLSHALLECGLDPSYAVGGIVQNMKKNGGHGKGDYFIAEACESDGTFLRYPGYGAIVTNIDADHLDYWKNKESLSSGFAKFLEHIQSKEHFLYCMDNQWLNSLNPKGISYGFHENAEAKILSFSQVGWVQRYTLEFRGEKFEDIEISLIGKHNILNSAAIFSLGLQLEIREDDLRKAFSSFKGIGRRMEKKGEGRGVTLYDDYGHHPTEIKTTLAGLKNAIGKKRLIVAFQPHRFTRTRDCLEEFSSVFDEADLIFLTDIYSAGEEPIPGLDTDILCQKIKPRNEGRFHYFPRDSLTEGLLRELREEDVVLTIGAGDITKVGPELLERLS